jgi:hypothetical protein
MNTKSLIQAAAAVVGSAGIGMAVMYLFDPEVGDRRRRQLRDSTSHAMGSALETMADHAGAVAGKAQSLASSLTGAAASQAEHIADHSKQLGSYANRLMGRAYSSASDSVQDAHDSAKGYMGRAMSRVRHALGEPERPSAAAHWTGMTLGAAAALAVGAGLMFLLDPVQGRMRRQRTMDRMNEYAHRGSQYIQEATHNVAERMRSQADGSAQSVPSEPGSFEQAQ